MKTFRNQTDINASTIQQFLNSSQYRFATIVDLHLLENKDLQKMIEIETEKALPSNKFYITYELGYYENKSIRELMIVLIFSKKKC